MSFKIYISLPVSVKFSLSSANSSIVLADGQQAKTLGLGHFAVYLGPKEFQRHLIVAGLRMKAWDSCHKLIKTKSKVAFVYVGVQTVMHVPNQHTVNRPGRDRYATARVEPTWTFKINKEVFDCSDFRNQPLSSRCMVFNFSIRHSIVRALQRRKLLPFNVFFYVQLGCGDTSCCG